jgi:type IX secretion system PorP/SprF family membrane protein
MKYYFCYLLLVFGVSGYTQDAQFSQFYAAPLYINPAFTGTVENTRATAVYRNQWPTAGSQSYVSSLASIDHYFSKYNSGVGFMVMQNQAGSANLRSTEASLFYSYHIYLNEKWKFIPAIQASMVNRNINFYELTFPDQFTNTGYTGAPSNEPGNYGNKLYADFSTGGLLHSDVLWFGVSYHHLNHPNQSFTGTVTPLPGELNIQGGAKIPLDNKALGRSTQNHYKSKALMPSFLYKQQGNFSQLDAGMYLLYEPLIFGVYYRGLPFKHYAPQYPNVESVILMMGFNYQNFTFGYSYDFIISKLTAASGGANEVTLTYLFGKEQYPQRSKYKNNTVRCPAFYNH